MVDLTQIVQLHYSKILLNIFITLILLHEHMMLYYVLILPFLFQVSTSSSEDFNKIAQRTQVTVTYD